MHPTKNRSVLDMLLGIKVESDARKMKGRGLIGDILMTHLSFKEVCELGVNSCELLRLFTFATVDGNGPTRSHLYYTCFGGLYRSFPAFFGCERLRGSLRILCRWDVSFEISRYTHVRTFHVGPRGYPLLLKVPRDSCRHCWMHTWYSFRGPVSFRIRYSLGTAA